MSSLSPNDQSKSLDQEQQQLPLTNTIRMGNSRTNIKIENETIHTNYGNMPKTFYSTITILGTISEPKFKLEHNKFIEYKQLKI